MARYVRRVVQYEETGLAREDLMSQESAARLLGVDLRTVGGALDRGTFTEIVDTEATHSRRDRRFLLKSEVEEAFLKRWQ